MSRPLFVFGLAVIMSSTAAAAGEVEGKVFSVDGHLTPACRMLYLTRDDGGIEVFRLPDTGSDNSMLAVAMTALTTGNRVLVHFDAGAGTGCGTELRVGYIRLFAQ